MKKIVGNISVEVWVTCPECGEYYDLIHEDGDQDYVLYDAIFTNTTESCTNLELEYVCPKCDKEFVLDKMEY